MLFRIIYVSISLLAIAHSAPSPYFTRSFVKTPSSSFEQYLIVPDKNDAYRVPTSQVHHYSDFQFPKQQVVYYNPTTGANQHELNTLKKDNPLWQQMLLNLHSSSDANLLMGDDGEKNKMMDVEMSKMMDSAELTESSDKITDVNGMRMIFNQESMMGNLRQDDSTVMQESTTLMPKHLIQPIVAAEENSNFAVVKRSDGNLENMNDQVEATSDTVNLTQAMENALIKMFNSNANVHPSMTQVLIPTEMISTENSESTVESNANIQNMRISNAESLDSSMAAENLNFEQQNENNFESNMEFEPTSERKSKEMTIEMIQNPEDRQDFMMQLVEMTTEKIMQQETESVKEKPMETETTETPMQNEKLDRILRMLEAMSSKEVSMTSTEEIMTMKNIIKMELGNIESTNVKIEDLEKNIEKVKAEFDEKRTQTEAPENLMESSVTELISQENSASTEAILAETTEAVLDSQNVMQQKASETGYTEQLDIPSKSFESLMIMETDIGTARNKDETSTEINNNFESTTEMLEENSDLDFSRQSQMENSLNSRINVETTSNLPKDILIESRLENVGEFIQNQEFPEGIEQMMENSGSTQTSIEIIQRNSELESNDQETLPTSTQSSISNQDLNSSESSMEIEEESSSNQSTEAVEAEQPLTQSAEVLKIMENESSKENVETSRIDAESPTNEPNSVNQTLSVISTSISNEFNETETSSSAEQSTTNSIERLSESQEEQSQAASKGNENIKEGRVTKAPTLFLHNNRFYVISGVPEFYANFDAYQSPRTPIFSLQELQPIRPMSNVAVQQIEPFRIFADENNEEQKSSTRDDNEPLKMQNSTRDNPPSDIENEKSMNVEREEMQDEKEMTVKVKKREQPVSEGRISYGNDDEEAIIAKANPEAVSISGRRGVSLAGPKGTAFTGKKGFSVASPKATAIAGRTDDASNLQSNNRMKVLRRIVQKDRRNWRL